MILPVTTAPSPAVNSNAVSARPAKTVQISSIVTVGVSPSLVVPTTVTVANFTVVVANGTATSLFIPVNSTQLPRSRSNNQTTLQVVTGSEFVVQVLLSQNVPVHQFQVPVIARMTVPSSLLEPRLLRLFYLDPASGSWVDSASQCPTPCPPRINLTSTANRTVDFLVWHLTQFNGFADSLATTSSGGCLFPLPCTNASRLSRSYCTFRQAEDGGGGWMDQCACRPGRFGVDCSTLAPIAPFRWTLLALWGVLFVGVLAYVVTLLCRARIALAGARLAVLLLLMLGSASRIAWLAIDPYTLQDVMPPVADMVLSGLYFPLSLTLEVLMLLSFAASLEYVGMDQSRFLSLFSQRRRHWLWLLTGAMFPFTIAGDVLFGLFQSDAMRQAGGALAIVALAIFAGVSVLLCTVTVLLHRRFRQLKSRRGIHRMRMIMAATVIELLAIVLLTALQVAWVAGPVAALPTTATIPGLDKIVLIDYASLLPYQSNALAQQQAQFVAVFFALDAVFILQQLAVFFAVFIAPSQVVTYSTTSPPSQSDTATDSSTRSNIAAGQH